MGVNLRSASESDLPRCSTAGTGCRVTPMRAGVPALPGRRYFRPLEGFFGAGFAGSGGGAGPTTTLILPLRVTPLIGMGAGEAPAGPGMAAVSMATSQFIVEVTSSPAVTSNWVTALNFWLNLLLSGAPSPVRR